ncbi:unnamed protein product [Blepharisma stoltei]|uniref:Uncharacterized protein n=1 Tax=Blepharisma stoltei TaxID=1481888 RepID=A0AAU9JTJ5_9CILI|nr:unnamed protein product [Blepharisma stoltei]
MGSEKIIELNFIRNENHEKAVIAFPNTWNELLLEIINAFSIDPTYIWIIWNKIPIKPKSFTMMKDSGVSRFILLLQLKGERSYFQFILKNYKQFHSEMNRKVLELYKTVLIEGSSLIKSLYIDDDMLIPNFNYFLLLLPFLDNLEYLALGSRKSKIMRISMFSVPSFLGERSFTLENRLPVIDSFSNFDQIGFLNTFGQILATLPKLEYLDFSYAFTDLSRLGPLCSHFSSIKTLKALDLSGIAFNRDDTEVLLGYLLPLENLKSIELDNCLISNAIMDRLIGVFGRESLLERLKFLSLRNNQYLEANNFTLSRAIETCRTLEVLDLSSSSLYQKGMWSIHYALMTQIKLKKLYLANNYLQNSGDLIVECLPSFKQLTHLDISNNYIGTVWIRKIVELLPNSMELIDIGYNNCNLDIFITLNEKIPFWSNLSTLNIAGIIEGCSIVGNENYSNFLPAASLKEFEISFENIHIPFSIYQQLSKCPKLRILSFRNIGITEQAFPLFKAMIESLENLEVVYLKDCKCEKNILEKLFIIIRNHPKISVVGFEENTMAGDARWMLYRYNLLNRDFQLHPNFAVVRNNIDIPGAKDIEKCKLCNSNCGYPELCQWARRRAILISRKFSQNYKLV